MKKKNLLLISALALLLGLAGCGANKKKKCDTCPKWTSFHEIVSEISVFKA